MAGQKPRQGWIYGVDPSRVSLTCRNGHSRIYELSEHEEIDCKISGCGSQINSSHVTRGKHPYIVWTSNQYMDGINRIPTLVAVPLSSQTTFAGLPDVYPINKTAQNSLTFKSYALVHQVRVIDARCFKDHKGDWVQRIGQLSTQDRSGIEERLKYLLGISSKPSEDWFRQNTTPELIQRIYGHLTAEEKNALLENLISTLE